MQAIGVLHRFPDFITRSSGSGSGGGATESKADGKSLGSAGAAAAADASVFPGESAEESKLRNRFLRVFQAAGFRVLVVAEGDSAQTEQAIRTVIRS